MHFCCKRFIITAVHASLHLQLYDRRSKKVKQAELKFWKHVTPPMMSDSSDVEEEGVLKRRRHSPKWRSPGIV